MNTFKNLQEKMNLVSEKMVNLSRKMQIILKMEISELKNTTCEMKSLRKLKIGNCRRISELDDRLT